MSFTVLEPSSINSTATFTFANLSVSGNIILTGSNVNSNLGNSATANYFIGNGALLTGIVSGTTYANSNVAAYLPTYTGNVSANYFIGNGSTLTSVTGGNVTGYVPLSTAANTAGTVTTAAQPNITSVGTLTSLTVSGLVTATGTGIKTANIQDSTGTLTITTKYNNQAGDIGVYGNIVAGTSGSGNVTATYFIGDGSQLTGLPASYSNTNVAAYLPTYSGNFTAGNATVGLGVGGSITGGNLLSANYVSGTLTTAAQPNITSVGTLSSLSVTSNVSTGNVKTDNLLYANGVAWSFGSTSYSNTNVAAYLPTYAGTITAGNIYANSGTVRGTLLTGTITTAAQPNITSLGTITGLTTSGGNPLNSIGETKFWSSSFVDPDSGVARSLKVGDRGIAVLGGIKTDSLTATGNISASYISGTLTTAAQPNITSVGTLTSATITTGTFGNSVFTKFQEKVVAGGSVSGTITPNAAAGTIYTYTLTGAITLNALTNAVAGTSMTIILTQGGSGVNTLTSTMKFAGGSKTLSLLLGSIDIVSVFYDGSTYYAVLTRGYE